LSVQLMGLSGKAWGKSRRKKKRAVKGNVFREKV
jgi:hypothetical protein